MLAPGTRKIEGTTCSRLDECECELPGGGATAATSTGAVTARDTPIEETVDPDTCLGSVSLRVNRGGS